MKIQLQIEVSSYCNAKCIFCPYSTVKRAKGFMDMDLFKKIIDEATLSMEKFHEVQLTGLGESLLDKLFEDRIRYVKEKMPGMQVGVYTNGTYLTPERFESLADAGLDYVVVSLNALTGDQRKRVMRLDDWEIVQDNLKYAFNNRDKIRVEVHAVANGERTGGAGLLIREGNWAGDNRTIRDCDRAKCCNRAIGQIYIMWNGIVSTCCFDPYGKQVFGDLKTQTLQEMYASERYVKFRGDHFDDRADQYELCAGCNRI
jgi:MoaA/NifB/PqqE/SkfB family radical SAM enzyme